MELGRPGRRTPPPGWGGGPARPPLADLLDGSRATRARLQGRLDIEGRRRWARRHLAALGRATRSPAELARAGAWLDPLLLARALARRVDAAWPGGHRVTVAGLPARPGRARV